MSASNKPIKLQQTSVKNNFHVKYEKCDNVTFIASHKFIFLLFFCYCLLKVKCFKNMALEETH